MKKFIFLHIVFLLSSFSFFSQVEFNAKLSKNSLGLNERVKIEFSVDKDGDNFTPPSFDRRVAVNPQLEETDVVQCYACREPLLLEEQESTDYVIAKSCSYCIDKIKSPN